MNQLSTPEPMDLTLLMGPSQQSWLPLLILLFPLFGFLLNGIVIPWTAGGISKTKASLSGVIATLAIGASFVAALVSFAHLRGPEHHLSLYIEPYRWLSLGGLELNMSLRLDRLSQLMTLIITGVGTLIHLYSIGYMSHEKGPSRFFAYLNLFCFAMLLLVMGDNLPLLFFGWEGVGLCSYLLIGYWYDDPQKASAGKKAFIVNRIGDLGFLLGMFLLFKTAGTLQFSALAHFFAKTGADLEPTIVTAIALLFFVGATGKSAQIPLFVWLPDAMAGPTPVSALIHAATMVTAGVYMIARMHFLFDLAPVALSVIAHVGALTAFLAATIAIAQNDIKKVLAYSTVSQLGFMFLAAGLGAYQTAVFHLMTHAFFKALLFLGSGSVIHGCGGEQDMRKMGGLWKLMPITSKTMLVGFAAIAGLPFFSGFFSKDEIIYSALALPGGSAALYFIATATAALTAVYMTRMMVLTFAGTYRGSTKGHGHHGDDHGGGVHESPLSMTVPLMVLALLAALGGFLGVPHILGHFFHMPHSLSQWLAPAIPTRELPEHALWLPLSEPVAMTLAVLVAVAGIVIGWKIYRSRHEGSGQLHQILADKYYLDEIYNAIFVRPFERLSGVFFRVADRQLIDASVMGLSSLPQSAARSLRALQSGDLQQFALMIAAALVVLLTWFWVRGF